MDYFKKHGIISNELTLYHNGCRDYADINVMLCNETDSFVLDKDVNTNYKDKGFSYWNVSNIQESLLKTMDDDQRRYQFINGFEFNTIMDFGCGNGGFLKLIKNSDNTCVGVDLNEDVMNHLKSDDIITCTDVNDIDDKFDVITMFHVLEHLSDPITILNNLKTKMNKDSILVIEVPSANDILLRRYDCEEFKRFTFWSEHLILYSHESLRRVLEKCNFANIEIMNEQRYNMLNHLQWISKGLPGGHQRDSTKVQCIINEYDNHLKNNNLSDTLIAVCRLG
jgi:SAM-dependent methyltransferase